jgi:hypothetical protein
MWSILLTKSSLNYVRRAALNRFAFDVSSRSNHIFSLELSLATFELRNMVMGVCTLRFLASFDATLVFPLAVVLTAFAEIKEAADFGLLHGIPKLRASVRDSFSISVDAITFSEVVVALFVFLVPAVTGGAVSRGIVR